VFEVVIVAVLSYLTGSIPSALWAGRLTRGIDIREHGSGNVGTTNTFRVLGWKAGVAVAAVDLWKGWFSAQYIAKIVPHHPEYHVVVSMMAGIIAVIGHMFPLYSGFKGGKGALTAGGVMLGVVPISALLAIGTFLVLLFTTRYASVASMLAAMSFPLYALIGLDKSIHDGPYVLAAGIILPLFVVVKHRSNISRLIRGTESRLPPFFGRKSEPTPEETA
jgi:glycerol-3-phosphate acyltransferase PlsY